MKLPPNHPYRFELNDEVHARPPEALRAPCAITYLALSVKDSEKEAAWVHVTSLAQRFAVPPPARKANHFSANLGPFRIKWERHTEFVRYKFIVEGPDEPSFAAPAIAVVPEDWLAGLVGQTLVATNVVFRKGDDAPDADDISARHFAGNTLVASYVAGGAGRAYTDFRIYGDGFGRLLVEDLSLTHRQAGRMVQRLLEIDTYRMLALLAFPVARDAWPFLASTERDLAEVTAAIAAASEHDETLLGRLNQIQAAIESRVAQTEYRFSAAAAYYELVQRRIAELRERRIEGLQLFAEFMDRRLAPAVSTFMTASARQQALSERVARATQLLSTKVDISREKQNSAILASMDRRAKVQLRLQQTVEGLSIAAITYYFVSLIGYLAKGMKAAGFSLNADAIMGLSIPVVALLVAFGVHRVRKAVSGERAAATPDL